MKPRRRSDEQVPHKLKYFCLNIIMVNITTLLTSLDAGQNRGCQWRLLKSRTIQSIGEKWGPKPVSPSSPFNPPEGSYLPRTLWCSLVIRVECSLSMYLIASSMIASYRHHTHTLHVKTRLTTSNVLHTVDIS